MMWHEVNLLYELKSPVHIGYLPSKKGSVISPTRYYVPGKNFWGAFTKILTETLYNNPTSQNYRDVGEWFKKNVRFTYFYIYDEKKCLLFPKYTEKEGLRYGNMSPSEFQNKFIGSFISTAIDKGKGTAEDESLHEIEYINPKYSTGKGIKNTKIFGKMFIKKQAEQELKDVSNRIKIDRNGITVDNKDPFKVIFVGGELNYGFGKIEKLESTSDKYPENIKFDLTSDDGVYIDFTLIMGHMKYFKNYQFKGDVEMISGREYKANENNLRQNPGKKVIHPEHYFTPGTRVIGPKKKIEMDYSGLWFETTE